MDDRVKLDAARRPARITRRLVVVTVAALAVSIFAPFSTVLAEDPCVPSAPHSASAVLGHTWSGTVISILSTSPHTATIRFAVERVYANVPGNVPADWALRPNHEVTVTATDCPGPADLGLKADHRYLVSVGLITSDGLFAREMGVAWELLPDGSARFVDAMYRKGSLYGRPWSGFARATSLSAALAIVAPAVPDTSSERAMREPEAPPGGVLALLAGLAVFLLTIRSGLSRLRHRE